MLTNYEKESIICKLFKNLTYYGKLELLFFPMANQQPHHHSPRIIKVS